MLKIHRKPKVENAFVTKSWGIGQLIRDLIFYLLGFANAVIFYSIA